MILATLPSLMGAFRAVTQLMGCPPEPTQGVWVRVPMVAWRAPPRDGAREVGQALEATALMLTPAIPEVEEMEVQGHRLHS